MKLIFTIFTILFFEFSVMSQTFSSFEDFDIEVDSFWNGSDGQGAFVDGSLIFENNFDSTYNFWSDGWAVSSMRDDSTAGFTNTYSSIKAGAARGSKYAIGQNNAVIQANLYDQILFQGLFITNTTYAYLSMKDGDSFAKKFGGVDGTDEDFFKLRIYAKLAGKIDSSNYVDFYLADYRDADSTKDYIVNDWRYVDLTSLGYIDGLSFELTSSDVGQWGMNTPAFFAIDKVKISYLKDNNAVSFEEANLQIDSFWIAKDDSSFYDLGYEFESKYDTSYGGFWSGGFALSTMRDDSTIGFTNLYGVMPGGAYDGISYAVSQNNTKIKSTWVDAVPIIRNIKVTNTTYAYNSMKNGDSFAKKFGGATGEDPDFFKLRIIPRYQNEFDFDSTDYFDFYLADFRFDDYNLDYIIDDWIDVNIDSVFDREVVDLAFELSSSDNGQWGMNTPGFFALDRIEYDLKSATNETINDLDVNIFPNPAIDYLELNTPNSTLIYAITDIMGNKIAFGKVEDTGRIDISKLDIGCYFVEFTNEVSRKVIKFIKIK